MREQRVIAEHQAKIALMSRQRGDIHPIHDLAAFGFFQPAAMRSSVLFPLPEEPSKHSVSPLRTSRLTPRSRVGLRTFCEYRPA